MTEEVKTPKERKKKKPTAYQIISRAEKLLSNKENWGTGRYAADGHRTLDAYKPCPKGTKFCALGALMHSINDHFIDRDLAERRLHNALLTAIHETEPEAPCYSIIYFNDKQEYGYDTIISGYRALKAKLKANPKLVELPY